MAVLRPPVADLSGNVKTERANATKLVCLGEANLVRDERPEVADRTGPGDPPQKPAAVGKVRDAPAGAQSWSPAVYTISPFESDSAAPDVDQTLGQLITATRELRGISREHVTEETRIPAHYVRMIESDNYDAVPDELYLLPFIRSYAIFLGLDSQKVVSRFIREFEEAENEVVEPSVPSASAKTSLVWQRLALAAMVAGVLLPWLGWAIGARTTVSHPADSLPPATTSTTTRKPSRILSTYAPPVVAVQQLAQAPTETIAPPAIATTTLSPKVEQRPTQTRPPGQRGRRHRHSRAPGHRRWARR
jgi:hypothetical protein